MSLDRPSFGDGEIVTADAVTNGDTVTAVTDGEALTVLDPGSAGSKARSPGELRPVLASGLIRALLIPVSALLALGTASILVRAVGPTAYGGVIFVGTLFLLLPFADLGVGAAVSRAIAAAENPTDDPYVAAVIRRCLRLLTLSAALLILGAVAIAAFGQWGPLLGLGARLPHVEIAATLTIIVFAVQLPWALGQRALHGVGKNHVVVAVNIVQPATAFVLAVVLRLAHAPAAGFILIYPVAVLVSSVVTTVVSRRLTGIKMSPVAAWRAEPGATAVEARVMPIALPMFLIAIGLPVGLQCDKFVISHRLPRSALTEYALCSQLFVPGWLILSAAAFALLPVFVKRRTRGIPHVRLWVTLTSAFVAMSVLIGVVFVIATPLVARIITSGHVRIGLDLRLAFAALLVVQTVVMVSSTVLSRPEEMRFQAVCVMAMMVANVLLSWWLAGEIGVAGPVVASAVTVGLLMTLPCVVRAARSQPETIQVAGSLA